MAFRTPTRFRITFLAASGVLVAVVAILAVTFLPRHTPSEHQTDAPFGAYARYVWFGRVSSVQGAWRVPAIIATSRPGFATTWIGAQGAGTREAFVQVGAAELRGYSPKHLIEDQYWAFWSNKAHEYHPQSLFSVKPGDRLSAALARSRSGWTLTISDATSHKTATLNAGEGHAPLSSAQWTQEDALTSNGARYTYPSFTAIRIGHLLVNAVAPSYAHLYSTWMSISGAYQAPSPLRGDSFQLRPATLTSAGKHYLSLRIGESRAAQQFGYELERWTANTPHKTLETAASRLVAALSNEIHALRTASLPPIVKGISTSLARKLNAIVLQAQLSSRMSPSTFDYWRAQLTNEAFEALYTGHLLRRQLGLPELP
jgi:hypothetical protein